MMYQRDMFVPCLVPDFPKGKRLSRSIGDLTALEKAASTPKKKNASRSVMMITMIAVATVSLRVGQWTLEVSART